MPPKDRARVKHRLRVLAAALFIGVLGLAVTVGQNRRIRNPQRNQFGERPARFPEGSIPRTAREVESDSLGTPNWTNPPAFTRDAFTFTRVAYTVQERSNRRGMGHTADRWAIDFPDSDLNLSFRLQQVTSLMVDPDCRVTKLTDTNLFNFPFIYIIEPGRLTFTDEETTVLRRYLLNGGFLMFDDFWGTEEWEEFEDEIKKVLPGRKLEELALSHPIFNCVVKLPLKPQVPGWPHFEVGRTTEPRADGDEAHYRAIYDDKGRMMVLVCFNTDLGDGWEREANEEYFHAYAEKFAYPLGINILFYTMTH